jgi:hypothetical protein
VGRQGPRKAVASRVTGRPCIGSPTPSFRPQPAAVGLSMSDFRRRRGALGRSVRAVSLLGLVALFLAACASLGLTSANPTDTLEPDILQAMEFRSNSGLQADSDWVRRVAGDPAAQPARKLYGIPLMPAEVLVLEARAANADELRPIVRAYGERHPSEYGGAPDLVPCASDRQIKGHCIRGSLHSGGRRDTVSPVVDAFPDSGLDSIPTKSVGIPRRGGTLAAGVPPGNSAPTRRGSNPDQPRDLPRFRRRRLQHQGRVRRAAHGPAGPPLRDGARQPRRDRA